MKWKAFFKRQAKNAKYLHDGDVVEASVATDDGAIDLGTQRNTVRCAWVPRSMAPSSVATDGLHDVAVLQIFRVAA